MKVPHVGSGVQHSSGRQEVLSQYPPLLVMAVASGPPRSHRSDGQGVAAEHLSLSIQHSLFEHSFVKHFCCSLFSVEGSWVVGSQIDGGHVGFDWQHSLGEHVRPAQGFLGLGIYDLAGQLAPSLHVGLGLQHAGVEQFPILGLSPQS